MLIICYGMPKSASSFVSQLTRCVVQDAAEAAGEEMVAASDLIDGALHRNFVKDKESLVELAERVAESGERGRPVRCVAKTHAQFPRKLLPMFDAGHVKANVTYRHPADIALSLLDAGARDRAQGVERFAKYEDYDKALGVVAHFILSFESWRQAPDVRRYAYEFIRSDAEALERRIATHVGLQGAKPIHARAFLDDPKRIGQFNTGQSRRRLTELGPDEIARAEALYPDFCARVARKEGRILTRKAAAADV